MAVAIFVEKPPRQALGSVVCEPWIQITVGPHPKAMEEQPDRENMGAPSSQESAVGRPAGLGASGLVKVTNKTELGSMHFAAEFNTPDEASAHPEADHYSPVIGGYTEDQSGNDRPWYRGVRLVQLTHIESANREQGGPPVAPAVKSDKNAPPVAIRSAAKAENATKATAAPPLSTPIPNTRPDRRRPWPTGPFTPAEELYRAQFGWANYVEATLP